MNLGNQLLWDVEEIPHPLILDFGDVYRLNYVLAVIALDDDLHS